MKFKVGDKVTVRQWDDMKKEYGLYSSGDSIPIPVCSFVKKMELFCGKKVTIEEVYGNCYGIEEDDCHWYWTDEMFENSADKPIQHLIRGDKTIIKLPNGKVGVAKCDPKDEFSEGIGAVIATARAYGLNLNEVAKLCEKKEPRKIAEVGDYVRVIKTRLDLDPETILYIKENGIALVQNGKWKDWFYPFSDNYFPDYKILTSEEVEEFKKKHKESK